MEDASSYLGNIQKTSSLRKHLYKMKKSCY